MKTLFCALIVCVFFGERAATQSVGTVPQQYPCWKEQINGTWDPQCFGVYDKYYTPEQCLNDSRCWCVNWKTGKSVSTVYHARGEVECYKTLGGIENTTCLREGQRAFARNGLTIPVCDPVTGNYDSKQCDSRLNTCWCVSKTTGMVLPDSLGSPVKLHKLDCDYYATMTKKCLRERLRAHILIIGAFVPNCDDQGYYKPAQCHFFSKKCWCVDVVTGDATPGTQGKFKWSGFRCGDFEYNHHISKCERARRSAIKRNKLRPRELEFVPECVHRTGSYRRKQCYGILEECWCVNPETGDEIYKSRTSLDSELDCETFKETEGNCPQDQQLKLASNSTYIPRCDPESGMYLPRQCKTDNSKCWCVDPVFGREIERSRTGNAISLSPCSGPEPTATCIEAGRPSIFDNSISLQESLLPNECDPLTGRDRRKQCDLKQDECWCLDLLGSEIPETRSGPIFEFAFDCDHYGAAPGSTECLREQEEVFDLLIADYEPPDCDPLTGKFKPRQCTYLWSKQCRCVDVDTGSMLPNSTMTEETGYTLDCVHTKAWTEE